MHVRVGNLLRSQHDCVATWQLRELGMGEKGIAALVRDWHNPHSGVHIATRAVPSREQLWRAATLTAPGTCLAFFSAAVCWGIYTQAGSFIAVSRPGTTGHRTSDTLVIHHSQTLAGDTTTRHGIPVTTPERTIVDFSPALNDQQRRKLLREAFRRKVTTNPSLASALERHSTRRGTRALKDLTGFYSLLQLDRCKSDAEAYAMELLAAAKRELPDPNTDVAGLEADLAWPVHRLIIEIDGPQFHRDKLYDAHKTVRWNEAGWTVRRIESDDVFGRPERLLGLAPR